MSKEKMQLSRGKAFFNLTGLVKRNDYTFKQDEVSPETGYKYSRLNLGIETGAGNTVYSEAMGGFYPNKENVIYVASKDDITDNYTIDWADRFDDKVLETIHDSKFIKIGVEQYEKNGGTKTTMRRFLSWYDAIEYLNKHLAEDMIVNVNGNLKYSKYQDKIQVKKEIKSIFLAKAPKDKEIEFKARFTQTILIDKYCMSDYDKATDELRVFARVLDYTKMWGEKEVKTTVPYDVNYTIKDKSSEITEKLVKNFFKVKKGITELAVEGDILEGTPISDVTDEDIPSDLKDLIDIGLYTREEIIGRMVVKGPKVSKFVITRPYFQMKEDKDGTKRPQLFCTPEKYTDDDLLLDFMIEEDNEEDNEEEDTSSEETTETESADEWLNQLK